MELKIKEYQIPGPIVFNFDELKTGLTEKADQYAHIVYTDDNIKTAKEDRADLNRLKKALNDERIRRQKEYMKPFDAFKAQIDEIINIIDKPVLAIDAQIKEFEQIKQDEKKTYIEDMFNNMLFPEFVKLEQVWNLKWLNATFSMKQIEEELLGQKSRIISECQTLASLPSYHTEAVHFYQKTLSMEQALAKVRELTEVDKARAEARKIIEETAEEVNNRVNAEALEEPKIWVGFEAYLNRTTAAMLKDFFGRYNIEYKPISMKEEK